MEGTSSKVPIGFLDRWKTLNAAVKDFGSVAGSLNQYEELVARNEELESDFATQKQKASELESGQIVLTKRFENRYSSWQAEMSQLKKEMKELTVNKDEYLREMNRELVSTVTRLREKEQELSRSQASLYAVRKTLDMSQLGLNSMKSAIGIEELDASFGTELSSLSGKLQDLVKKHFCTSLPEGLNMDGLYTQLQRSRFVNNSLPTPVSNSVSSKYLRMATAQAIIAQKLTSDIFRKGPHLPSLSDSPAIQSELDQLFQRNPLREAVFRSILVTAYAEDERYCVDNNIQSISESVCRMAAPLLSTSEEFERELQDLLKDAAWLWDRALRNIHRIFATIEGGEWDICQEYQCVIKLDPAQSTFIKPRITNVILFPRIYSHENSSPLHPGYAILSNSDLVISGRQEAQQQATRVRTNSMVGDGALASGNVTNNQVLGRLPQSAS